LVTSETEQSDPNGYKQERGDMNRKGLQLILLALIQVAPLSAQQESGVSLTIRFANSTTRFHVGEAVPIELSFSASTPDLFDMEMRDYDRSGRLNIEQFHVTPPGRDPLQRYYSMGLFTGGGLGGLRELSIDPQIIHKDLNEWVALDHPGHYSLYVTSGRVSRRAAAKSEPIELRSNPLEFDVVAADAAWQQQTLTSAMMTLKMESSTPEENNAALRTLRFLDTPSSVTELVRLLGARSDSGTWNEVAGLAGSRYQSLVVRELEQMMVAPDVAVTANFLYILAKLKFQLDHEPPPPYPKEDPQQQKAWTKQRQSENKEFMELQDSLYRKTASVVSSKWGAARAETVQTILQSPAREPGLPKPLSGLPPEEVASAFLNLSPDEQWGLLSSFWDRLKIPTMVSPLKKVVQQPDMKHQMLRDVALQRLNELDPSEAAPVFLEEIKHPHLDSGMFTVKAETLGLLGNETLPQFDEMLASRLQQNESRTKDLDAQLVGRFSTKVILPQVKAIYEASPNQWDCSAEDGFVLYFLRVDPDYGVKRLAIAPSSCMRDSLLAIVKMRRWSEVEPGIVVRLNGADLNRARQAAETLARFGSPRAEKAMWERLASLHEQWKDRAGDLADRPGMPRDASEAVGFQFGLVESIGKAQAWLLTSEEVTTLENLTLGQERDNVKQWHWNSPVDLSIHYFNDQIQASINNQYNAADLASLQAKLAQYPAGTAFQLTTFGPPDLVARAVEAIKDTAAKNGLQVEEQAPPN
jgi:hypothetical protein